jgi:hypothetical protein
MGGMSNVYIILVGKPKGKRSDRKITSEWKLRKQDEKMWEWIHHLTQDGNSGGPCEQGNEPPGYVKGGGNFLES